MGFNEKKSTKTETLFKHKSKNELIKRITKKEKKIFVRHFDNKIKSTNTFNLLNFIKKRNQNIKLFFFNGC